MSEETNETATSQQAPRRHYGYRVVGGIFALALVLGVLAFQNMKRSIITIESTQKEMAKAGKKLSMIGCIDRVMEWKKMCGAIHVLCRASISRVTASCLEAKPRKSECQALKLEKSRAHFTYKHCKARGMHKRRHWKRECGVAYGTLHRYCQYWNAKSKQKKLASQKAVSGTKTTVNSKSKP